VESFRPFGGSFCVLVGACGVGCGWKEVKGLCGRGWKDERCEMAESREQRDRWKTILALCLQRKRKPRVCCLHPSRCSGTLPRERAEQLQSCALRGTRFFRVHFIGCNLLSNLKRVGLSSTSPSYSVPTYTYYFLPTSP
jgi:hypothetical protein